MFVFLLAGTEVVLSAIVLATCNFFCIKKRPQVSEAKLEMAVTETETEQLNKPAEDVQRRSKEAEKDPQEENKKEMEEDLEDKQPSSPQAQSEVEETPKDSEEQNGGLVANTETYL